MDGAGNDRDDKVAIWGDSATYSQAVDVYSFGIIMYEAIELKAPWWEKSIKSGRIWSTTRWKPGSAAFEASERAVGLRFSDEGVPGAQAGGPPQFCGHEATGVDIRR